MEPLLKKRSATSPCFEQLKAIFTRDLPVSNRPSDRAEELRLAIDEMMHAGQGYLAYLRKRVEPSATSLSAPRAERSKAIRAATPQDTAFSRSEQRTTRSRVRVPLVRRIWLW